MDKAVRRKAYVVALQVKVREVEGDFKLGRRVDFPRAVFVAGVESWETWTGDGSIGNGKQSSTRICKNKIFVYIVDYNLKILIPELEFF